MKIVMTLLILVGLPIACYAIKGVPSSSEISTTVVSDGGTVRVCSVVGTGSTAVVICH